MINAKREDLARFRELAHSAVLRRRKTAERVTWQKKEDILLENRIFAVFCENPSIQPSKCAIRLENEYHISITGNQVIRILKARKMGHPDERSELFEWANQLADLFGKAIAGEKNSLEKLKTLVEKSNSETGNWHESQGRICVIGIYQKFPEIAEASDEEILYKFGNSLGKNLFYALCDAVGSMYNFKITPNPKDSGSDERKSRPSAVSAEQAAREIETLRNELERTNDMLSDLQNEFEEQLNESKIKEMTDFFAMLNSESYGCILDQLLTLRENVEALRKSGFKLPIEINGILALVKNMWKFVIKNQIKPMWQPGSEVMVKASDVEFSNYTGSPFTSEEEVKCVKVLSPGWVFRDKEVQISRPRLEEVKKDQTDQ